jgi:predicted P-loop ATPase
MGTVPTESEVLSAAARLIEHGVAVHWLHRRAKNPVGDSWQNAPVHTLETLKAAYRSGNNLGIRPGEHSKTPFGYLHLFDIDIRKPELAADAWACLLHRWPDARQAPYVISGSGGESRHVYVITPAPLRSMNLGHSDTFTMVFDPKKGRDVKKWDWSVDLYGAPKQAVLPPSVHPDTGENYVWGREIDWDLLDLGIGPIVSAELVETWGAREDDLSLDEDDDLMAIVRSSPMGLSEAEIDKTLADLPEDWIEDHDLWVQAGMALHHEYEGSQVGFEKWCQWARQSAKFDIKDHKTRWKSFKGRGTPVRMATLIKAAGDNRLAVAHADLDDLLGDDSQIDLKLSEVPANQQLALISSADDDLADLLGSTDSFAPGASGLKDLTVDPEWRSHFHRNEEGQIKSTLHNIRLIMRNDTRLRNVLAMNEFTQEVVLMKAPATFKMKKASPKPVVQLDSGIWKIGDAVNGRMWNDSHAAAVRAMIEAPERQGGYAISVKKMDMVDALDIVANERAFHPVREYLNGLRWDGVPRAERLWVDYVGAPDDAYHREAAALWLLGAVTRVFEPGHKFDFVPILEGLQGKRKSTFFRIMARDWFAELEGDFHDTQGMVEKMQGAWIMEIPELSQFGKSEITIIKGFISRQTDKVRLAYRRNASEFHRQCVFGGTTNDDEYLRDSTGGRRFWPVECSASEIDTDRLNANVDQIWAEVVTMYRQWRTRYDPRSVLPLYMKNEAAIDAAKRLQESRRQQGSDEVLAARIEEWLSQPIGSELGLDDDDEEPRYRDTICLIEIWEKMMGQDPNKYTDRDQQVLGRAMRKIKSWKTTGSRVRIPGYGQQRIFRKII